MVPSSLELMISRPSWLHPTEMTSALCPLKTWSRSPAKSKTRTRWSREAVATFSSVGWKADISTSSSWWPSTARSRMSGTDQMRAL